LLNDQAGSARRSESLTLSASTQYVESRSELVAFLESGCKPSSDWRLGTEHEKFGYTLDDLRPLPYAGDRGIHTILSRLAERYAWRPVMEQGQPIALVDESGASITLEPGGQLELSGALLDNIHQTCTEVNTHLRQVRAVCEPLGIAFLGMGFQPKWGSDDMQWMPKARYRIMRQYMQKVGSLGLDMMTRTCTVQVNLDFSSEAECCPSFSRRGWASNGMPITCWTCRCTSSIATARTSMPLASRSGIFSPASCPRCRARGRRSRIGRTT
jgi:glutamate--cysteine ligase